MIAGQTGFFRGEVHPRRKPVEKKGALGMSKLIRSFGGVRLQSLLGCSLWLRAAKSRVDQWHRLRYLRRRAPEGRGQNSQFGDE
jgi:hypothetical protein